MVKRCIIGIMCVFWVFIDIQAQDRGRVCRMSNPSQLLENVNIYIPRKQWGIITDALGEYDLSKIKQLQSTDTIKFSCVGYSSQMYTLQDLKNNNFLTLLSEDTIRLKEVAVIGEKGLNRSIEYEKLSPIPGTGIAAFGSCLIGDKIYLLGGDESYVESPPAISMQGGALKSVGSRKIHESYNRNMYIYDIENDKWSKSHLKFKPRAYHSLYLYRQHFYLLGGTSLSTNRKIEWLNNTIDIYDIKSGNVLQDKTNPHPAANAASFLYGDQMIVMGGSIKKSATGKKKYTDVIHIQNLKTGYWYEMGKMPQAMECKGILYKHKIYLFGGYKERKLDEIWSLDLKTSKWEKIGTLVEAMERPGIALVEDNIYLFENDKIIVYNLLTQNQSIFDIYIGGNYGELLYSNGKFYILGGVIKDENVIIPSNRVCRFELDSFMNDLK